MTLYSPHPSFNSDEKSSLQNILYRLGHSVAKPPPASLPTKRGQASKDADHMFTEEHASSLVDELFTTFGYATVDAESRDFLVSLLQEMPVRPGNAFEVADAYSEPLMVAIEVQGGDRIRAGMASFVFGLAANLYRNPGSKPWCDLNTFVAELDRLTAIPRNEQTDDEKEYLRFLGKIRDSGLLRRSCPSPEPAALIGLLERFPNFEEPLRFLAEQAAFARLRGDERFHITPLLLSGAAGIGKTHFAMALAEVIGSRTEVLSMASQSCGFAISGMDRGWSSARPGLVFNALLRGETLSPIIILDEIDKASQESKSDPLGPLYTLLEQRSSQTFKDEYAGISANASQVFWLATANDTSRLPGPLLSRFKVFEIKEPRPEHISTIAQQLFIEMAAGIDSVPDLLPPAWLEKLAGQSVREIRIALQQALGKAALRAVMAGHSELSVEDEDFSQQCRNGGKRIGFCG